MLGAIIFNCFTISFLALCLGVFYGWLERSCIPELLLVQLPIVNGDYIALVLRTELLLVAIEIRVVFVVVFLNVFKLLFSENDVDLLAFLRVLRVFVMLLVVEDLILEVVVEFEMLIKLLLIHVLRYDLFGGELIELVGRSYV